LVSTRMVSSPVSVAAPVTYASGDALFNALDTNGDGVISRRELRAASPGYTRVAAPVYTTAPTYTYAAGQPLFDALDTNGDGVISRKELRQATRRGPVGFGRTYNYETNRDTPEDALFDALDTNGDGVISRRELRAASPGYRVAAPVYTTAPSYTYATQPSYTAAAPTVSYVTRTPPVGGALFNALDRNGDGVITRNELRGASPVMSAQGFGSPLTVW